MTTLNITVRSDIWTQLTTQSTFTLQNIGSEENATPDVYIAAADGIPTVDKGHDIAYESGITSNMITGTLWGKARSGTAIIAVTE